MGKENENNDDNNNTATEEKKEKKEMVRLSIEQQAELSQDELAKYRKGMRDEAGDKINAICAEYGVDLSAKMIIGPGEIVPQVVLVNARPHG